MIDKEHWVAIKGLKYDEMIEFYKSLRLDVKIRIWVNSYQNQDYSYLRDILSPHLNFVEDWDCYVLASLSGGKQYDTVQGYWECTVADIHPRIMERLIGCRCMIRYDSTTRCEGNSWAAILNKQSIDKFPKGTIDKWTVKTNDDIDIKQLNLFKKL